MWGNLGPVLIGGAMLSTSLIQFSIEGWSCVSSLLFTWGQTMVEVMKIMVTSFQRSHAGTATLSAPDHAAALRQLTPPLESPGHSRASLGQSLVGYCSFLLGPDAHKVLFVPSQRLFPQSCVSFHSSWWG